MDSFDETPDFVAARDHVLGEVVSFARTLRRNGLSVPANAALSATEALCTVGLRDRESVYAATHATLVTDARDTETFEAHFPEFWYRLRTGLEATATSDDVGDRSGSGAFFGADDDAAEESVAASGGDPAGDGHGGDDSDDAVRERRLVDHDTDAGDLDEAAGERSRASTYSAGGAGSEVDEEGRSRAIDRDAVRQFERALSTLSGRRWTAGGGRQVDARRALRSSVSTGGAVVSLPTRERKPTAFRTSVLVDVSQSVLDTVDRGFLLQFLDTLVEDGRGVRVFFFDTDIREVTDVFTASRGNPVLALERAQVAWGGGTKIGHAISELRTRWPDAVDRRTVTLVVSDGLDVGDVSDLERGMTWLSGRSRAVLWLNPLAASAKYEPTCRGMAASLPYVDGLFALAGPEDLSEVARQIRRHGPHGPIGYEHDFRERAGETGVT
ncbi:VWA containing CoxE-like protein [Salinigranum rubrum]|uniref:VWA containing CoxE-like protein n=1 Tax=Salinigranum rubrum TaxID=755307 RepID=A0A2I8VKH9_9EURY|nr:VWA domain-containing protein [Salinigranum rubrum]AUV82421.1 VWA containing CoxE-like protein [Salinigranum rubrum]